MKNKWFVGLLLMVVMMIVSACGEAATPEPTATVPPPPTATPEPTPIPEGLWINTSAEMHPISPLIFGTNYGPLGFISVDLFDFYDNSGLTFIRFPGGRFGDENDVSEKDIDRLFNVANRNGAQVNFHVRLWGGTPEQAAELVRYTNIEKEYGVTYWSIGNEPSLYQTLQRDEQWTTEYFNEQWRLFAEAMLEVDPSIKFIGPDSHQFVPDYAARPKDLAGKDWLDEFLIANGDMIDMVSIHRYPFPQNANAGATEPEMLRVNSAEWDEIIPALRETIVEHTGKDLPISILELNSNWANVCCGEATPDSHLNAIWLADVLGRLIKQDVAAVAQFELQRSQASLGMLARYDARPPYYVYPMYKMFGQTYLDSGTDDELVTAYAARRDDGAVTVMLINLNASEVTKSLTLTGVESATADEVWRFDAETQVENLGSLALDGPITLPAESLTLLVIR